MDHLLSIKFPNLPRKTAYNPTVILCQRSFFTKNNRSISFVTFNTLVYYKEVVSKFKITKNPNEKISLL